LKCPSISLDQNIEKPHDIIMRIICLDLEGVLIPEVWIALSHKLNISELMQTTRDIPDYNQLMNYRLDILNRNNVRIHHITELVATMKPLEGAREFLSRARMFGQPIILSDTFEEFIMPLISMLGNPLILCNNLHIDNTGVIQSYHIRQKEGKQHAVRALQDLKYFVTSIGDSYNDLSMLRAANQGILFRPPLAIKKRTEFPVVTTYQQLLSLIEHP